MQDCTSRVRRILQASITTPQRSSRIIGGARRRCCVLAAAASAVANPALRPCLPSSVPSPCLPRCFSARSQSSKTRLAHRHTFYIRSRGVAKRKKGNGRDESGLDRIVLIFPSFTLERRRGKGRAHCDTPPAVLRSTSRVPTTSPSSAHKIIKTVQAPPAPAPVPRFSNPRDPEPRHAPPALAFIGSSRCWVLSSASTEPPAGRLPRRHRRYTPRPKSGREQARRSSKDGGGVYGQQRICRYQGQKQPSMPRVRLTQLILTVCRVKMPTMIFLLLFTIRVACLASR